MERGSRQVETCNLESPRPHTKIPCPFLVANLSQNPAVSEPVQNLLYGKEPLELSRVCCYTTE